MSPGKQPAAVQRQPYPDPSKDVAPQKQPKKTAISKSERYREILAVLARHGIGVVDDRSDGRFGQIFQGNFIHTRSLRLHGEQRAGNRLKSHRAAGSVGLSYSVPGIRPGFCAESTGMLSHGHSGALARD
jgi:hypothetical protein